MNEYFDYENKTVLITGDCFKLTYPIAEEFALEDARICIFSSDEDYCQKISHLLIEEYEVEVIYSVVDFNDEYNIEQAIQTLEDVFEKIDIIVNTGLRGSNEVLLDRLSTRNIYPLFQISKISSDEEAFDMQDKVAVVTGATGRIGEEIIRYLTVEQADIILFSNNIEKVEEDKFKYKNIYGIDVDYHICNLTDENTAKTSLIELIDSKGTFDYLVNAAGMGENKTVVDGLVLLDMTPLYCIVWLQQFHNL